MALLDVLTEITAEKPEKGKAAKKYVAFTAEEWAAMEKTYGKSIDPADVKKLVQGIFGGKFNVSVVKNKPAA